MTTSFYKQLAGDALETVRAAMRPYNWMVDEPDSGPGLRAAYLRVFEAVWRAARLDELNARWMKSMETPPDPPPPPVRDETGATHLETSAGPMTMVDRDRWIYFDVEAYADQMGEILFDFECETDPDVSPCVDGNPRIVIHAPGGGDAILIIRFQPDGSLILNTDSHLQIEHVNLPNVSEDTWHVRDPYFHRAYQPKETNRE